MPSFVRPCRPVSAKPRSGRRTLKGVCANLSFTKLLASASRLTELLRPEADTIPAEAVALMETVAQDYELTVSTIRAYLDSAH